MEKLHRIRWLVTWTGLVLLVVGAKLWLVDLAGSSLPVLDQIDGEGEVVLRPWLEGWLRPYNFWHPHNEHRIVFTKLMALGLVAANGQWDAYVEMFFNAFLHALLLPALLIWLRPHLPRGAFPLVAVAGAAMWILPLNWENTLQGFQNQFYFTIWLAFLQCRWVLAETRFGWRWWTGNLCGLFALFAMGSGFLASLAVSITVGAGLIRQRRLESWSMTTLAVSLVVASAGWLTRVPVPGHEPLRADGVGLFLQKLGEVGAWPFATWFAVASVFAVAVPLQCFIFLKRGLPTGFPRGFFALACWVFLIGAATAYTRGNGVVLSPRYFDQYYVGLLLQGAALAMLARGRWRWVVLLLWLLALGIAFAGQYSRTWDGTLGRRSTTLRQQENHVRAYFETGDPAALTSAPLRELPYPSAEVLIERWKHPSIQSIMPGAVRPAVEFPPVGSGAADALPPAPYPVIAVSPAGVQHEPWIWRSERQSADALPILRFRFSGELGDPRAALTMRVVSDAWAVEVRPDGPAPNRWKTINVIRPPGEWWIELSDRDSAAQVALTAPVEMGWLSWAAEKAIKYHRWWIGAGLALLLAGLLAALPARGRADTVDSW